MIFQSQSANKLKLTSGINHFIELNNETLRYAVCFKHLLYEMIVSSRTRK